MFCNKCGAKIDDDALFCPKCGNSVNYRFESEQVESEEVNNQEDARTKQAVQSIAVVEEIADGFAENEPETTIAMNNQPEEEVSTHVGSDAAIQAESQIIENVVKKEEERDNTAESEVELSEKQGVSSTSIRNEDSAYSPQIANKEASLINEDTMSGSPSEEELKKQKKTTNIMAGMAVAILILACLFVFVGNIKPGTKRVRPSESNGAEKQEETIAAEIENADADVVVAPEEDGLNEKIESSSEKQESGYVSAVSEIPSDLMDKMKAQTVDNITAYAAGYWDDNISVAQTEYIGSYLLRKKDSSNAKYENIIDVAYAVTASIQTTSGKERKATMLFYTSFFDLKKNADGSVDTDLGKYETPGSSFVVDVSSNGKKEKYYFVGYETVDAMYKDLVLKNVDQYSYDGDVQYIPAVYDYAEEDNLESINGEFGIDSSTVEDYASNLNKDYFGYYDYGIADFSFAYPLYIYNNVTKNEESFTNDYGTNVVTFTFSGSRGSRLVYSLTRRDDSRSIKDMSKYVYSNETNILIDSSDIVNSMSGDHGKVIVTGWEDSTKDFIIYDMTKIEKDYVLQMKVYMTNFTDDNDKNEKSYVTECDYRYCGFSDSKYSARTYEEYLEAN